MQNAAISTRHFIAGQCWRMPTSQTSLPDVKGYDSTLTHCNFCLRWCLMSSKDLKAILQFLKIKVLFMFSVSLMWYLSQAASFDLWSFLVNAGFAVGEWKNQPCFRGMDTQYMKWKSVHIFSSRLLSLEVPNTPWLNHPLQEAQVSFSPEQPF